MAPRTFVNKIDHVVIYTSPKCSCRSVSDFAWEVANTKPVVSLERMNIIVFRNPYHRLVSGYLNKYVEHTKYLEASRVGRSDLDLGTFDSFVDELHVHGLRSIDKVHFSPQITKYQRVVFQKIFNSENLENLAVYLNTLFSTDVKMPFRVNKYGPKHPRARLADDLGKQGHQEVWKLNSVHLLSLIQSGQTPAYSSFYNEVIRRKVREIYAADFDFLHQYFNRGIIDQQFLSELTVI